MASVSEISYPTGRGRNDIVHGAKAALAPPVLAAPTLFVGEDARIREILEMVARVADTDATILISGESGTGKDVLAKMIHGGSSRRSAPFLAVNSGAIAESLQESELFGHARGAFTGAEARRVGLFEAADGGTLFLDEVSEMSRSLQVKMLRVLQSGEYTPVGQNEARRCDVRVIAASNQPLRPLVEDGKFRKDLFYRLNIIHLDIPPLRERRGDIPRLVEHFLHRFGEAYQKPGLRVDDEVGRILLRHPYPGNVRELENVIRRAVVLARAGTITVGELAPELTSHHAATVIGSPPATFHEAKALAVEVFERDYLTNILVECGGIISRAASRSGLCERNFHEKLKRYGIAGRDYRR